jgi:hypothetical protein
VASGSDWKLLLRTGFGNVFTLGRWRYEGTVLIAKAVNSAAKNDWRLVEEYAHDTPWLTEWSN